MPSTDLVHTPQSNGLCAGLLLLGVHGCRHIMARQPSMKKLAHVVLQSFIQQEVDPHAMQVMEWCTWVLLGGVCGCEIISNDGVAGVQIVMQVSSIDMTALSVLCRQSAHAQGCCT